MTPIYRLGGALSKSLHRKYHQRRFLAWMTCFDLENMAMDLDAA